jgi:putative two-component system response regulator
MDELKRILVVDDEPDIRELAVAMLTSWGYVVEEAADGFEALAKLKLGCDLVVSDLSMPRMDGFEIIRRLREDPEYQDLPIVVITALTSKEQRLRAIEIGANDFITKPIDPTELKIRVASLLRTKEIQDAIKRHKDELEKIVAQRTAALRQALDEIVEAQRQTYAAYLDTIQKLALAAEFKDEGTAGHLRRIALYSESIAQALKLTPKEVEILRHASPMHDVGKIGIPEGILLKAGLLDKEEWEVMQRHTIIGARILQGSSSELLTAGETIALTHHEKWDGTGYPQRLAGEAIPIYGRIVAVADVFDALTTRRPYKKACENEEALAIIRAGSGSHFDPAVVAAFFRNLDNILDLQARYIDQPRTIEIDLDKIRY